MEDGVDDGLGKCGAEGGHHEEDEDSGLRTASVAEIHYQATCYRGTGESGGQRKHPEPPEFVGDPQEVVRGQVCEVANDRGEPFDRWQDSD